MVVMCTLLSSGFHFFGHGTPDMIRNSQLPILFAYPSRDRILALKPDQNHDPGGQNDSA
jgi:hypothetical protein